MHDALLAAAAAALAAILVAVPLQAADGGPEELIRNGGFDEDANGDGLPDGWSVQRDRIRWQEKVYLSRDYEIVSQGDAYVLATQDVPLVPGRRYTLTLTAKGEGGASAGALILHGPKKPTQEMHVLWRVEVSAEYEKYTATFVAPEGVARLYLYNCVRQGTIYYDRVSLYEGEPTDLVITPLAWHPLDRPVDPPLATPHVAWAAPLPQGPLKTLITLRAYRCLRDVCEVAQRVDLDYDLLHTGEKGEDCISETNRRMMKRLEDRQYQVYLVASRLTPAAVKTIRERVEAGAGLVVLEGFGQAAKLLDVKQLQRVDDQHYLRAGVPWDRMPEKILAGVETGTLGQGRVVRLVFPADVARVWGLLPMESSQEAYKSRQFEYWEWWYALLARSLRWAAGQEGDVRLSAPAADGKQITLSVAQAPAGARVRIRLRSGREIRFDGPLVRCPEQELPLPADGRMSIAIDPRLPAGMVIADVLVLNAQGAVLTSGSFAVDVPQAARIESLTADQPTYRSGDTVGLTVKFTADEPAEVTVEARLIDAFGRVVASQSSRHSPSAVRLPLPPPLCVHHRAMLRLLVAGREQDSAWVDVLVPEAGPRRAAEDFLATTWSPGMSHPAILAQYAAQERRVGLNAEFGSSLYAMSEHGTPCGGYIGGTGGAFRVEKHSGNGVRPRCLSDPKIVDMFTTGAEQSAGQQRPYGMFAVGIADEAFIASRHRRDEMCFSPHCQERFRQWLREQYGTLEKLNTQWGAAYGSWDEIRGAQTEDVRGRENFAPFVDFRIFMTDVWIEACRAETEAYHRAAPETPVGHTNTFGADPFCGNDYWKLCTRVGFGWGQEYSEAIKAQGQKAVFELWRSFVDTPQAQRSRSAGGADESAAPFFNYGWIGYSHLAAAAHYEPWWLALHGSRGVSYYATNSMAPERRTSWALVHPTMSLTGYSQAVEETLADLRAGCGKLLMEYHREQPRAAVLWSYPSMLVAWCESSADVVEPDERPGTDSYGTHYRAALNFRQHLDELQLDYTYLAPEQILGGDDVLRDYRLVLLPFTVAASGPLVERLRAFVESGGVVVGDLRCLRTDEHGTPTADERGLSRLFGVRRRPGGVNYGKSTITFSAYSSRSARGDQRHGELFSDLSRSERSTELYGREPLEAADATPLAAHATGEPAVLVRPLGKGFTVYLNFYLPEYDLTTRDLVRQIVARSGIERDVVAENPSGDAPPKAYERNTLARGPIRVHGFIRDHRRCQDSDPVRFCFGPPSHVYDVRAGKYLGQVSSVETTLAPGDTALYACLPYRVAVVKVTGPEQVRAGETLSLRAEVPAETGTRGDHVFHVELIDPAGNAVWHYAQNVLAGEGKAEIRVALALNDPPGRWTAKIRDVLSGAAAQHPFQLESP